ncbi:MULTISPECIES: TIM barrel protein [unclassified Caballeronia]|uniref:sugar phosphate isomerase/epimerase family protein n=1 Tax=unclassified Caballeronia TaxID=2646786 RepID=UPI00285BB948|nr:MULTISPECIES: TIM barrel protein [unclassified Caballeronia]MDR5738299.1 TIM barrel protein [Caballeronia sp. LZ016]MDR5811845.1 TIM barrel protein [Caballeronia sp. LZ019]
MAENSDSIEVVIVASAFGADAVRRDGHAACAEKAALAGADGFEVRRELFANDADAQLDALSRLGEHIHGAGLWAVHSTPAALFRPDGSLDADALTLAIDEGHALGARIVKLQLGGEAGSVATDPATLDRITHAIAGSRARVVVENGQSKEGGLPGAFEMLFAALPAASGLSMTFDTGNWYWADVDPLDAAQRLASHVAYVHCKTTQGEGARRFAVAPAHDDTRFAAILGRLPSNVPRAIEYPFRDDADAAVQVARIAAF